MKRELKAQFIENFEKHYAVTEEVPMKRELKAAAHSR